MNQKDEAQRKAFDFLKEKFKSQDEFTKEAFKAATGWAKPKTVNTYFSKQYKGLLIKGEEKTYRVSEAFRRLTSWNAFKKYVTQVRYASTDYITQTYDNVILFEFFMPLANEGHLRQSLDALFYKDSVLSRLKIHGIAKLEQKIPRNAGETEENYLDRVCEYISNKFGGYSITHVDGRFKADRLKSYKEVYTDFEKMDSRYLVDETTAIVRFIFPCGEPNSVKFLSPSQYVEDLSGGDEEKKPYKEAALARWFFYALFVQSIVQTAAGEDEIWMLESGMRSRLHIWKMSDKNKESDSDDEEEEDD